MARAERPPQDKADAPVVLTGVVESINETWDLEYDYFLVHVRVSAIDRGPGINVGDLFGVRCFQWSRPWPGKVGAGGHRAIPAVGDEVRVYAFRRGPGYEGSYPDWFDVVRPGPSGRLARWWASRNVRLACYAAGTVIAAALVGLWARRRVARSHRPTAGSSPVADGAR
jgi:hypothetical protein